MLKFTFADIALNKRAFRVTTVVAKNPEAARRKLHLGDHWIPQIGDGVPTLAKPGRKSRLYRHRVDMVKAMSKLGFTVDQVEQAIHDALPKMLGNI